MIARHAAALARAAGGLRAALAAFERGDVDEGREQTRQVSLTVDWLESIHGPRRHDPETCGRCQAGNEAGCAARRFDAEEAR